MSPYHMMLAAGNPALEALMGLLKAVWGIIALLVSLFKALFLLGGISAQTTYNAAETLLYKVLGWSSNLLMFNPVELIGSFGEGSASSGGTAESAVNVWFSSHLLGGSGANGIGTILIEAGLGLTLIAFFYGFSESTVQLEKTNIQLIFSRILRWIIAVGLVTVSYQLVGWLFLGFRSFYDHLGHLSAGSSNAESFFQNNYSGVFSTGYGLTTSTDIFDWDAAFSQTDFTGGIEDFAAVTSLRSSLVGAIVMLLGLMKLFKKLIKFVVGLIPNLVRVVALFVCAPLGIAMYAAPETQQKANSYIRTFAAAVFSNLLKVMAMGLVTIMAVQFTVGIGGDSYRLLDTYGIASAVLKSVYDSDIMIDFAFLMTSGGLLGMHLVVDLLTKTCEISDRFAQEVLA